jgi:hypothetical protein
MSRFASCLACQDHDHDWLGIERCPELFFRQDLFVDRLEKLASAQLKK